MTTGDPARATADASRSHYAGYFGDNYNADFSIWFGKAQLKCQSVVYAIKKRECKQSTHYKVHRKKFNTNVIINLKKP